MRWTSKLRLRLRSLLRRTRVEDELGEELQYHLERLVDDYVSAGMPIADAQRRARREMGAIEQRKEECRDARGMSEADRIRQDLTYAFRSLSRAPAFTFVAVLSLALGIGANTAIFSLWNGVLHASLPAVTNPQQLVILSDPNASGSWTGTWNGRTDGPRAWLTYAEFEQLRDHAKSFSGLMASQSSLGRWRVRFTGDGAEEVRGRLVSGTFFDVFGVQPAVGRLFTTAEDHADSPYAVISYGYWQRRFGGRPEVVGKTFTLRNATLTVIGVSPRGFIGETSGQEPAIWLPLRLQMQVYPDRDRLHDQPPDKSMWLAAFGRLRPGVTPAQAEGEANAIFRAGLESFYGPAMPAERRAELLDQRIAIQSGSRGASPTRREFSSSLSALLAAVGVLLLTACANLANLLLARGTARKTEIAVRFSLGASRGRIVRQLITESLVLAVMGAVAAVGVAAFVHDGLVRMIAESDPRFVMTFTVSPLILTFVVASTLGTVLLFGALPAWQVTRTDASAALRDQARGAVGSAAQVRSGRWLVIVQLALSLPLIVGAGLLVRTVYNLQHADLGFASGQLSLLRVDLREGAGEPAQREMLVRELVSQIQRVPGVRAVTYSQLGIFSGGESFSSINVEGYTPKGETDKGSAVDTVGSGYFAALGIPITLGRDIEERDRDSAGEVCVINEAFAKQFFDKRHPIGMRITVEPAEREQVTRYVVGVAKDAQTHTQDFRRRVAPRFYVPARPGSSDLNSPTFLIRTATNSARVMTAVRDVAQRVTPSSPITDAGSIDEQMAPLTAQDRTTARLAVGFGAVALALAAVGLYGVLSYGVARRTGELAIRIALGARSSRVIAMILQETVVLLVAALAFGAVLAYASLRLIDSRLYGIEPQDPLTLASAAGLLVAVAIVAAYLPAHRASRVDPMMALRQQ
jgi:predicted permease